VKDTTKDSSALLLTEVFSRAFKQQKAEAERERDEFRRRLRVQETD
jgi:hypothetical protein